MRTRNPIFGARICLFLLTLPLSVVAQPPRYVPAQFSFENRLFEIEISRDDVPRGAALVRCQGFVEIDGTLSNDHCVTGDVLLPDNNAFSARDRRLPQSMRIAAHRELLTAVINAIPEQRFVPAQVDGSDVRVLMNFAVLINCFDDSCATIAMPNHGYSYEEYGYKYTSPQPILPDDDWYQGFEYKLEWTDSWMPNVSLLDRWDRFLRIPYTMSVAVDTDGIAYDGCLNTLEPGAFNFQPRFQSLLEHATASLNAVRFIPGFYENRPVPMRFYETSVTRYERYAGVERPFPDLRCRQGPE